MVLRLRDPFAFLMLEAQSTAHSVHNFRSVTRRCQESQSTASMKRHLRGAASSAAAMPIERQAIKTTATEEARMLTDEQTETKGSAEERKKWFVAINDSHQNGGSKKKGLRMRSKKERGGEALVANDGR